MGAVCKRAMRVDAAEFVPCQVETSVAAAPQTSKGLSASSPEFVPSATSAVATWWVQGETGQDAYHPDVYEGDGSYVAPYDGADREAGLVSALLSDQDSFVDV